MDEFLRCGICMESSRGFLARRRIGNILYRTDWLFSLTDSPSNPTDDLQGESSFES